MLSRRVVVASDDIVIEDVACRHPAGPGDAVETTTRHALVFVRRGCFVRAVDGVDALLDPTLAYCMNPGEEERFDHPQSHGDDCTMIAVDAGLAASLPGGEETLPSGPWPVPPRVDLAHRLLLAAGRNGADPDELTLVVHSHIWHACWRSRPTTSAASSAPQPATRSPAIACNCVRARRSSGLRAARTPWHA